MLMTKLASKENISSAFERALSERFSDEHAMLQSERVFALAHKDELIDELMEELKDQRRYQPQYGFYYSVPKSEIVDRYVVYLPFRELVLHYAFILVIAEILDPQLIKHCFANRLDRTANDKRLTKRFADHSWPNYCAWQEEYSNKSDIMLITDLSSFFDNIDRQPLLEKISRKLGTSTSSPFIRYFSELLSQPILRLTRENGVISEELVQRPKGILTGPSCNGMLANFYLMDLDLEMSKIPNINYGRYVDDIKLLGNDKSQIIHAFHHLQSGLHSLGLSINSSKTRLINNKEEIIELVMQEVVVGSDYHGNEEVELQPKETIVPGEEFIVDVPFDKRKVTFNYDTGVNEMKTAKLFCFFLQDHEHESWKARDILILAEIIKRFPSSSKHAAWLLVSALMHAKGEVFNTALKFFTTQLLQSSDIHEYCKARCLHHLIKHRKNTKQYLFEVEGLVGDKGFRNAVLESSKVAETTLLKIYALEVLFALFMIDHQDLSCTKFLSACVDYGMVLNSVETQVLMKINNDIVQN